MNCFIFTQPDDLHAVMVQLALEKIGHNVRLFFGADQPTKLNHSVWVNANQTRWYSSDTPRTDGLDKYDVVWHRRLHKPKLPKDRVHADDYQFSSRENLLFFEGLTTLLSPKAWWINSLEAVKRANSKLHQLQLARMAGLIIPHTLCSNCPEDIRLFIRTHQRIGVVYKPLCSSFWFEEKGLKGIYTSKVTADQLPEDEVLALTPGIFQSLIPKKYELRITCFGSQCIAVKINSQQCNSGQVDWRAIPEDKLELSSYPLPYKIKDQLSILMKTLGIVFGCVDMIVTPSGEYVFLEINEQGQFLWIEEYLSEIPLLDCFIQFLLARNFYFQWNIKEKSHKLGDYLSAAQTKIAKQLDNHVDVRIRK